MKNILIIAALLVTRICCASNLYVSTKGRDTNPGTKDKPFATLSAARDAVRKLGAAKGSVTIWVREGTYYFSQPFELDSLDSGTNDAPVIYRAYPNEKVILCGSNVFGEKDFKKITDKATLSRIAPQLRNKIVSLDLSKTNLVHYQKYADNFIDNGGLFELFMNGTRMPLSRYPNNGFMTIKKVLINGGGQENKKQDWRAYYSSDSPKNDRPPRPGVFEYRDKHTAIWCNQVDRGIWLKGYWRIPWQNEAVRIGKIDTAAGTITLAVPVSGGIGNKYQRPEGNGKEPYWLFNLLEEIDVPGEWAVDFKDKKLYFYPPQPLAGRVVHIADSGSPVVKLNNASHVILRGFIIEENMGEGIEINGGYNNMVAGCTLRNLTKNAVVLAGGKENVVQSCDMYSLGAGGVWLSGGDEDSNPRIAAGHRVVNNHIHHFAEIEKVYAAGINCGFTGGGGGGHHTAVGMYIAHNLIHDTPHVGVLYGSWDSKFEYNEVYGMCQVSNDMGGFYCYDKFERMGNFTFCYNYVHSSPEGDGLYWDNDHRDVTVYGNILFLNSLPDKRGTGFLYKSGSQLKNPQRINCYNNIAINCNYGFQFVTALPSKIENNVTVNCKVPYSWQIIQDGKWVNTTDSIASGKNMIYNSDPGFVDMAHHNFRLKPDARIFKDLPGFQPIPFEKIGLYVDEYRTKLPTDEEIGRYQIKNSRATGGTEILDRN